MADTSGIGPDYDFLNSYISKLIGGNTEPDNNVQEDDTSFYDVSNDEDQGEDASDHDYDFSDNSNIPESEHSEEEPGSLGSKISNKESQGKYTAYNPSGGGTGAVGKYQFRWNVWKDSIKDITGVKTQEQFLHSPKAQEQYYQWYEKNYLLPKSKDLQKYNTKGLSEEQLAQLVHFRGAAGAKKYLLGQQGDKPEPYNMSTSAYIGLKQKGGAVAMSSSAQYHGLNNGSFDSMVFPMEGEHEFRGLDSGEPVYLEDEHGKKKILKGKKHKTIMKDKVFETRLK